MNVLDSNVEALAFNYMSFGLLTALNNLWTWLALLTAALSFWKIRCAGFPKPKPELQLQAQAQAHPSIRPDPVANLLTEPKQQHAAEDIDGVRKRRFTVYYEEEGHVQCRCSKREGLVTAWEEEKEEGSETEWWKRWERMLQVRNGESENGWYTWQDLTELNGNVVRLWDGGLSGSFVRESWYNNSSCIHVL